MFNYTCTYACAYVYMCRCLDVIYIYVCACMRACVHACIHKCNQACMHACMHACRFLVTCSSISKSDEQDRGWWWRRRRCCRGRRWRRRRWWNHDGGRQCTVHRGLACCVFGGWVQVRNPNLNSTNLALVTEFKESKKKKIGARVCFPETYT